MFPNEMSLELPIKQLWSSHNRGIWMFVEERPGKHLQSPSEQLEKKENIYQKKKPPKKVQSTGLRLSSYTIHLRWRCGIHPEASKCSTASNMMTRSGLRKGAWWQVWVKTDQTDGIIHRTCWSQTSSKSVSSFTKMLWLGVTDRKKPNWTSYIKLHENDDQSCH